MIIRKYEEKDEEQVVNLWNQCNLIVPQNNPHEDIKKKIEFQPNLFFVGTVNDEVIASIMVGYEGHRGWINYMAVLPEYQNKGYGRQLVDKAIAELKKLGCLKVNLQVRENNKDVIEFYENLGFSNDRVVSLGKHL
ncbi:GNAT family acetyltransferase [candidate division WOR-3 bacterium]|nr:GNAT family acetyltransferase [candidate division WOR-3 bacterium]